MSEVHRPRPTIGEIIDSMPLPTFAAPDTPVAPKKEICADSRCMQFVDDGSEFCCNCGTAAILPAATAPTEQLIFKLLMAQNASCSCMTKTNVVAYHDENCLYRVLEEAATALAARQAPDSRDAWPEEPTPEMQAAGAQAIRFDTTIINKMWTANAVYRAMRAAQEKAQ